jgi:hypothetical protein
VWGHPGWWLDLHWAIDQICFVQLHVNYQNSDNSWGGGLMFSLINVGVMLNLFVMCGQCLFFSPQETRWRWNWSIGHDVFVVCSSLPPTSALKSTWSVLWHPGNRSSVIYVKLTRVCAWRQNMWNCTLGTRSCQSDSKEEGAPTETRPKTWTWCLHCFLIKLSI